jgi:rhamnulokinase
MKRIAIDLGASNGRVVVCETGGGNIADTMDIVHRFPSHTVELPTGLHWNLPGIYEEIITGLGLAVEKYGVEIASAAIDSWGVDYSLIDGKGQLMFLPYHYRDEHTDGIPERVFAEIIPAQELFKTTGVQIMQLNTIFQLYAVKNDHPGIVASADRYLSIPDLLTFWLTGEKINERSHASTTGLFDPSTGDWAWELIERLGLPKNIFGPITPSGTKVGSLRDVVKRSIGADHDIEFITAASHDTQSAAYTVGRGGQNAFLSCGTWSIIGLERDKAITTDAAYENKFSNEASGFGGYNLLKNIMGLWILQECVVEWEGETSYAELIDAASDCSTPEVLIDVNDPLFMKAHEQAGPMTGRINAYLKERGGTPIRIPGEFVRLIVESLADYYGKTVVQLEEISGVKLDRIHLIGGGSKNSLLARLTQEKTGVEVIVGEGEATAVGNVMIQEAGAN